MNVMQPGQAWLMQEEDEDTNNNEGEDNDKEEGGDDVNKEECIKTMRQTRKKRWRRTL